MAKKNAAGDWLDPRGKAVPEKYVPDADRRKDKLVEQSIREMQALEKKMKAGKEKILNRLQKHIAWLEKEVGVKREGKGNMLLANFSGDKQIEFSMNDIIEFDEKLQFAKELIDRCIKKWSEGSNRNLRVVIDQAFEVDKKGSVNTSAILKLRSLKINDPDWKQAMELISDSISVTGTRQYLVMRTRENPTEKFKTINLNFSSI